MKFFKSELDNVAHTLHTQLKNVRNSSELRYCVIFGNENLSGKIYGFTNTFEAAENLCTFLLSNTSVTKGDINHEYIIFDIQDSEIWTVTHAIKLNRPFVIYVDEKYDSDDNDTVDDGINDDDDTYDDEENDYSQ